MFPINVNGTYCYDSWFSEVKMAREEMAKGVDCCRLVKTDHRVFVYIL